MAEELALSMRPKTFDEMIGSAKLLKRIQRIFERKDQIPKCWLITGQSGAGKTTLARILSVAVQCRHQKKFGNPCKKCLRRKDMDITEQNASDKTGIDEIRALADNFYYVPKPHSRRKVIILNECHRLSQNAQDLLNQPMEDCPYTTMIILVTTRPEKILIPIQQRCTLLLVQDLELDEITRLIKRGLKRLHSKRSVSDLAEKLLENRITSPRLILKATQKYADTDITAEEAAKVILASDVDTYALCRSVIKGSWESVSKALFNVKPDDNIVIRSSVAGYLNAILLGETEYSERNDFIAKSVIQLNEVGDSMPATVAVLYKICKYFRKES